MKRSRSSARLSRKELNALPVVAPDLEDEQHFLTCPECGQAIDCRKLGDVLHHEEPGHQPIPVQDGLNEQLISLDFVDPMLPTLVDTPPDGEGWIHEIKYDGYRTQLVIDSGGVRAFTRNGHDWTDKYAPLVREAAGLACRSAIIDGEVIVQDAQGRSDFDSLRAAIGRTPERLVFMAFDLVHLDGLNLRGLAIELRRERLEALMGKNAAGRALQFSAHVKGGGPAFFEAVEQLGLEGIVSKKLGSRYVSGRARNWLKSKCWVEDEFVLVGTEVEPGGPAVGLLARETPEGLEYVGGAALTLRAADRERLWAEVDRLAAPRSPVKTAKRKGTRWVRPEIHMRVRYLAGSDKLRHATVVALSGD